MWGVIYTPGEIHVAPLSANGDDIGDGHVVGETCSCRPRVVEMRGGTTLVVHKGPE